MNILITGVNGFIGQHLAAALLRRKHTVVGLGRDKKCRVQGITTYYSGNVLDKQLVAKAMKNKEVVIHLAALTSHKEIVNNKFATLETNFFGTKNVLDAFVQSKSARKFFYPSTGKVYGTIMYVPISEDHPTNPLNILGKSKLIIEKVIDFYNDNEKECVIFRIFNIYGDSQKKNFLIPTILAQLYKGKTEIVLGDIEAKRDYVYIDDVINAFISAIEGKGSLGVSIYNICTGVGSSAAEIVKILSKIKGIDITIKSKLSLKRYDEMKEEYGSYEKAKRILGWEPRTSLEAGLTSLIQ